MRKILAVVFVLASMCSASAQIKANPKVAFNKLEWLIGTWERTNSKPGRTGHERWEKVSDNELHGFGVTLSGSDTVFMEKVKLIVKDDNIYYVAEVKENPAPVYFQLVELTEIGFVCENPAHDFPKKISYQHDGKTFKALTSGNGKSFEFTFAARQ